MITVINKEDIPWQSTENGDFCFERKSFTQQAGGNMLGMSMYKIMPNKKAFPFHFHYANEEAIYVLQGEGEMRGQDESYPIKPHDYLVFPKGKEYAHQVINTSSEELVYLCFSTMIESDVIEYPDSNKVGVKAGSPPGGKSTEDTLSKFFLKESAVDYYEGEE